MSSSSATGLERGRLNFAHAVEQNFAFLSVHGFAMVEALTTIVRYRKKDVELNIYHGRKSFEIGFEISRAGERFSLSEIIRVSDPSLADAYRNPIATTSNALLSGLKKVASLVQQYGEEVLHGDTGLFEELRRQRITWSEAYALDVLTEHIRPKAELAFKEGRYEEAAALYEKIFPRLSPVERKKLAAARKRA